MVHIFLNVTFSANCSSCKPSNHSSVSLYCSNGAHVCTYVRTSRKQVNFFLLKIWKFDHGQIIENFAINLIWWPHLMQGLKWSENAESTTASQILCSNFWGRLSCCRDLKRLPILVESVGYIKWDGEGNWFSFSKVIVRLRIKHKCLRSQRWLSRIISWSQTTITIEVIWQFKKDKKTVISFWGRKSPLEMS